MFNVCLKISRIFNFQPPSPTPRPPPHPSHIFPLPCSLFSALIFLFRIGFVVFNAASWREGRGGGGLLTKTESCWHSLLCFIQRVKNFDLLFCCLLLFSWIALKLHVPEFCHRTQTEIMLRSICLQTGVFEKKKKAFVKSVLVLVFLHCIIYFRSFLFYFM